MKFILKNTCLYKKKRFLFQELQLFVGKLRVVNRKTMSYGL